MSENTYGQRMMRVDFNPSDNQLVTDIKQLTADLIDMIDANKRLDPRLASIAISSYESAAMWAVKMATAVKKE